MYQIVLSNLFSLRLFTISTIWKVGTLPVHVIFLKILFNAHTHEIRIRVNVLHIVEVFSAVQPEFVWVAGLLRKQNFQVEILKHKASHDLKAIVT